MADRLLLENGALDFLDLEADVPDDELLLEAGEPPVVVDNPIVMII